MQKINMNFFISMYVLFFIYIFAFHCVLCVLFLLLLKCFITPHFIVLAGRRVEDRNDPMLQKMRRYIKAFSKEEEGKEEKTDPSKGSHSGTPQLRHKNRGGFNNRRSLTGWQMIRHSALGLEFGNEELEDEQDIKYV